MTKPLAVAIVNDGCTYGPKDVEVAIYPSRARAGAYGLHAPRWRPMAFKTLEAARAKLQRHPGFVSWVEH